MSDKPDFIIYDEPPKATPENPKPEWVKKGAGWLHKDDKGGNVLMDDGTRYIMRLRNRREGEADAHENTAT